MSTVNIKIIQTPNENRWKNLKNGDFAFINGDEHNTIPEGLYRIFRTDAEGEPVFFLMPMFSGPFPEGLFPYMVSLQNNPPTIKSPVHALNIQFEVQ